MHVLVDADPLVYRCGFAAEEASYSVILEHADSGMLQEHYASATAADGTRITAGDRMKAAVSKLQEEGYSVVAKTKQVIPQGKSHALHLMKQSLQGVEQALLPYSSELSLRPFLSGPDNYRDGIAKQRPYKGNRDAMAKPYWYHSLREYLTDNWAAYVVTGREADDEIGIVATKLRQDGIPYCIATVDKDLEQIQGLHYDYVKKVVYEIDEIFARVALWSQILSGDPTDNIPGCCGIGAIIAKDIVTTAVSEGYSDADLWDIVVSYYRNSQKLVPCAYKDQDPAAVALETAQLVYIQQRPQELWMPPGVPFGTIGGSLDD